MFTYQHVLIVAIVVIFIYGSINALEHGIANAKPKFCASCGHDTIQKTKTPGNVVTEIALWCCFFVPGMIYTVWRIASRKQVCTVCGTEQVKHEVAVDARRQQ